MLQEYGKNGHIGNSLYCQPEVCFHLNRKQSMLFHVGVGLWQRYVLITSSFHNLCKLDGQVQPNQ